MDYLKLFIKRAGKRLCADEEARAYLAAAVSGRSENDLSDDELYDIITTAIEIAQRNAQTNESK
jgi:hypothetical protein